MIKYVVTVGGETRVFYDRRSADEWFAANWTFGMAWSVHKYVDGRLAI